MTKPTSCMKDKRPTIILASASPRRLELLQDEGWRVIVAPSGFEEKIEINETVEQTTMRLAQCKAKSVSSRFADSIILGADTVVCCGNRVFGKPADLAEAGLMLSQLSGRAHWVVTAVCLLGTNKAGETIQEETWTCRSRVVFHRLSETLIGQYLKDVHTLDKAGGYSIQDESEIIVRRIEGLRSNVIGLPIEQVRSSINRFFKDWLQYGQSVVRV